MVPSPPSSKPLIPADSAKLAGVFYSFTRYKWVLLSSLLLVLLSSATLLSFPYLSGKLLDIALGQPMGYFSSIRQVFFYMMGIVLAQGVFSYLRMYTSGWAIERAIIDLRQRAYAQLLALPIAFYDTYRVGDLINRLQADVLLIQQGISTSLAEAVRQVGIVIVGMVLIFAIAPRLSLLLLAVLPVLLLIGFFFGRVLRKLSKEKQTQQGGTNAMAEESLHLIKTLKAFTVEALQLRKYTAKQAHMLSSTMRATRQRALFIALLLTATLGSLATLLAYGSSLVQDNVLSTGDLLTFILYTTFIGSTIASLGDTYGQLQKMRGAADRVQDILSEPRESQCLSQGTVPFVSGDICIEDLHFHYPSRPDVEILQGLTLRVPLGRCVALVGNSGVGKSTLLALLLRFYLPQKGRLCIGAHDISAFPLQDLRSQIGIVSQEPALFSGTIAENICYGNPSASATEVQQVAEQAYVTKFTDTLPSGLQTYVGERGLQLSGGQRQRVAIARVMLKAPSILVLDEATSALDSQAEQWVQKALQHLMLGRTTLIIAHRLSTIRIADCVYVIKQGVVAETGTHTTLLQDPNSLYKELVEAQSFV